MFSIVITLFAMSLAYGEAEDTAIKGEKKWIAPDGSLTAISENFSRPSEADYTDWDVVTIRNRYHQPIASVSLEEGSGISRATVTETIWSLDSRFLVFQTASSGGHSSWHLPTYVFDAKTSRIYSIDDTIGAITSDNSPLHFAHADTLHVDLWNFESAKDSDPYFFARDLDLPTFVKTARIALHSRRIGAAHR